ncbi:hypothetical protein GCM10008957_45290 [Deinococcus ruber]|uniref:Uncharacterized protein n=1 Tax=Deinococcus ruber TaxID=1848197 RepID=A0A918CMK3_9DEIO|nr:hypothetical protein GCM10008957_45290 [Deinococcus ruber]
MAWDVKPCILVVKPIKPESYGSIDSGGYRKAVSILKIEIYKSTFFEIFNILFILISSFDNAKRVSMTSMP